MSICERVSLFFCTMFRNTVEEEEEEEEREEREVEEKEDAERKLKHIHRVASSPGFLQNTKAWGQS